MFAKLRGLPVVGRAFDWGVNITNAKEKAATESFIAALMATDSAGNKHALARRMGVMYVISNRQIWSAYRASEGWRPYSGASAHRDHVHISLSWAGANGRRPIAKILAYGTVADDFPYLAKTPANAAKQALEKIGKTPADNVVVRSWGAKPELTEQLDHVTLATRLNLFDLERATRWVQSAP